MENATGIVEYWKENKMKTNPYYLYISKDEANAEILKRMWNIRNPQRDPMAFYTDRKRVIGYHWKLENGEVELNKLKHQLKIGSQLKVVE